MTTSSGGVLVSTDGPGGVGKTTTIEHLTVIPRRAGLRVHRTVQLSAGPIGALACDLVPTAGGAALAPWRRTRDGLFRQWMGRREGSGAATGRWWYRGV